MDYNEINENILGVLQGLKKRPGMYFRGEQTYLTYETFLWGYLTGLSAIASVGDITAWFTEKRGESNYSILFSAQILHLYPGNSEEEHIKILLDTVEGYFHENPLVKRG